MQIYFLPSSKEAELTVEIPEPAKNLIPEWYRNEKRFINSGTPEFADGMVVNNSIKACVPFYDAISSGYIQRTWCDIYIELDGEKINYHSSRTPQIISHSENSLVKISKDFYPFQFSWSVPWIPKTPKGWSVLMTNPFNEFNLNTYSFTGIIDSDKFYHAMPASYPFLIRKGFSGLIPKGTPMYQILPIKRENWKSKKSSVSDEERVVLNSFRSSYFFGSYKRFFHSKKNFK